MHTIDVFIANYFIFVAAGLTVICFMRLPAAHKKRFALEALVAGIVIFALAKLGAFLVNDPRPFVVGHFMPYFPHSNDNGFPSDHTLAAGYLGWMAFCYSKLWGSILLALALLIGASRVIAGVHHWIDIAGAIAISGVGVLLVHFMSLKVFGKLNA